MFAMCLLCLQLISAAPTSLAANKTFSTPTEDTDRLAGVKLLYWDKSAKYIKLEVIIITVLILHVRL